MKTAAIAILSLLAATFSASAVDLGFGTARTPYDAYMQPVKRVLGGLDNTNPGMDRVKALMREGLRFRYSYTEPYVAASPEVTAATRKGDCKAKALWLCDQMGDQNVRFVVGKAHRNSKLSHAWVLWKHEGQFFILDPTNTNQPIPADRISKNQYIPLFSWGKGRTFAHAETSTYLAGIARKSGNAPVANTSRLFR